MERKFYFNQDIVRDYMKENGLTVKEFCEKCGISVYAYRQYVNNDGNLPVPKLVKIAHTLNVRLIDILGV